MNTPLFSFPPLPDALERLLGSLLRPALGPVFSALPDPPDWFRDECLNRVLLLLNHVLQQEPAAVERLQRQQGKRIQIEWLRLALSVRITSAGLLALDSQLGHAASTDLSQASALGSNAITSAPDLLIRLREPDPIALARTALSGQRPNLSVEGDVLLAAEVAWLFDHVRWDAEEDLSQWVGDATAHQLVQTARQLARAAQTCADTAREQAQGVAAAVARGWREPQAFGAYPGSPGQAAPGAQAPPAGAAEAAAQTPDAPHPWPNGAAS